MRSLMLCLLLNSILYAQAMDLHGTPDFAMDANRTSLTISDPNTTSILETQIANTNAYLELQQNQLQSINNQLIIANDHIATFQTKITELELQISETKQKLDTLRAEFLAADYLQLEILCQAIGDAVDQLITDQANLEQTQTDLTSETNKIIELGIAREPILTEIDVTIAELAQLNTELEAAQEHGETIGPNDIVHLAADTISTINTPLTVKTIGVEGTLTISSELRVQNLLIYPNGTLILKPGAHIIIRDVPIDIATDPSQWGNGVIIHGKLRSEDVQSTTTVVRISNANAGEITLETNGVPNDWQIGDDLIIPRCKQQGYGDAGYCISIKSYKNFPSFHSESETVTIAAISGNTITLTTPLKWQHWGAIDRNGNQATFVPIARLTRPIVVESENPNGVRGHFVMIGMADIWLRGICFKNLGRTTIGDLNSTTFDMYGQVSHIGTNQIGRYAGPHVHHVVGPMGGVTDAPYRDKDNQPYQWILEDYSVDNGDIEIPQKWLTTIHRSSWGLVQNAVLHNCGGSGIAFEDGVERNVKVQHAFICDMNSRSRFRRDGVPTLVAPPTALSWGPEPLEPGVMDQLRRADSRGDGAFGIWWLRGLELEFVDNIICDINPGNFDQGWDPDQRPTDYWRGLTPLFNNAPANRGDMPETWVPFEQCGAKQLVTINGGESFAADQKSLVIRSAVLGGQAHVEHHEVRNYVVWNKSQFFSSYQNPLIVEDCVGYGDPSRLHDDAIGVDVSQGDSVFRRIRVDNEWAGSQFRIGRGFSDATIEDLDSASYYDLTIDAPPISTDHCFVTLIRPKFSTANVLYDKTITGYKLTPPVNKKGAFVFWDTRDYDSGRYIDQRVFNVPVSLRMLDWNGINYSVFASFQSPSWIVPHNTWTDSKGIGGLTNTEASAAGYTIYNRLTPNEAIKIPQNLNVDFLQE